MREKIIALLSIFFDITFFQFVVRNLWFTIFGCGQCHSSGFPALIVRAIY
jgi:hypothetical protein